MTTGRAFNLAVAFERNLDERGNHCGRAVAESSFHHVADYNWDVKSGCPSFVEEVPGDGVAKISTHLDDIRAYVRNLAAWLNPRHVGDTETAGSRPVEPWFGTKAERQ